MIRAGATACSARAAAVAAAACPETRIQRRHHRHRHRCPCGGVGAVRTTGVAGAGAAGLGGSGAVSAVGPTLFHLPVARLYRPAPPSSPCRSRTRGLRRAAPLVGGGGGGRATRFGQLHPRASSAGHRREKGFARLEGRFDWRACTYVAQDRNTIFQRSCTQVLYCCTAVRNISCTAATQAGAGCNIAWAV